MSEPDRNKRPRLSRDEARTFLRIIGLARPYWLRLLGGMFCSIVGGGSIIAMFLTAQQLLDFLLEHGHTEDYPTPIVKMVEPDTDGVAAAAGTVDIVTQIPVTDVDPVDAASGGMNPASVAEEAPADEPLDRQLFRRYLPSGARERLNNIGIEEMLILSGVMLLIIILNSAAVFGSIFFLQWVGQRVVMDLRIRFFAHLQRLPVAFYNVSRTGDMISRTIADTQLLQQTVASTITDLVRQPVMLIMVLTYIIYTEWRLALFSVFLVPIVVIPIQIIGRKVRRVSREGQKRLADLTSVMQEALSGVVVVKAFGQEAREERRFSKQCYGFFQRIMSATKAKAFNDPITHILGGMGGIGVLVYALIAHKPIEDCVIFACAIWALYEPLKKLGRISMEIQQSAAAADRVFEILDTPVTVKNRPDASELDEDLRELVFDNVAFSYQEDGERPVFTSLNLRIPAGQSLAVVGPSGCGKTTLISLLLRFFDVTGGSIRFNDTDIRDCTVESLRSHMGLVMQETFLFADTVAANIAYGAPDSTAEQIEDAARRANAHDFITELPQGYDTILGERGAGLSGGQRQRLAIARAILRQPPILILDEATSALDTQSERMVQADIDRLMGRYTVIVIAHRLSTIAKCDRIAVLGDGGVLEYGTHEELHAAQGLYRELHDLQFAPREAQIACGEAEE